MRRTPASLSIGHDFGFGGDARRVEDRAHFIGRPEEAAIDVDEFGPFEVEKWVAEGRPLSSEAPAHDPRTFAARAVESVYCGLDQAKAPVGDDGVVFWDVRTIGEFDTI